MRRALALLGPTASGKSALAMALAGKLPIEIVSVDSAQVYRGMDIGTAKPSSAERARVPHHLVDIAEPTERYSAGRFRADAIAAVQAILARGRIPLLVGGTMLYYRALASGLDDLPAADAAVRAQIDAQAKRRGWPALHAELARDDPAAAARIRPNDAQRIQRALEVLRLTGRPISALQGARAAAPPFALEAFAVIPRDRAGLHRRIAERFDAMLAAGLVEELRALKERYALERDLPSMRAVGYRQAWSFLAGEITREELREKGIAATRQLAKRQLTWLRAMPGLRVLDPADAARARGAIARLAARQR
jgi:tRNA dimethylallyltransferase